MDTRKIRTARGGVASVAALCLMAACVMAEPTPRESKPAQGSPGSRPGSVRSSAPKAEPAPLYTPEGMKITKAREPIDLSKVSISDAAREMLRRKAEPPRGGQPVRTLAAAGCLGCHSSLEGISVDTLANHIEHRRAAYYGCNPSELFGGAAIISAGETSLSGKEELKRSIDASGQNVRLAGDMATELARERWEAARKKDGWVNGEPPVPTPDWDKALEFIAAGKFDLALPPLKSHISAQIAAQSALPSESQPGARPAPSVAPREASTPATPPAAPAPPASTPIPDPKPTPEATASAGVTVVVTGSSAELEDTKRLLAFVLLSAGNPDAASAVVREMYRDDPRLARRPFQSGQFRVSERHLRNAFTSGVAFANRAKTGSSWLLAAMLAQSEGRLPLARTLIDKGVASGLDRDIADTFAVAIDEALAAQKAERETKRAEAPASKTR